MTQAHSILDRRRAGILLHITSLPGPLDNGDLGGNAYRFVDFLADHGITVWQTLPIGPTHPDGSPYQCLSAHAGNPLMIDLDWLLNKGWLDVGDIPATPDPASPIAHRVSRIDKAYGRFAQLGDGHEHRQAYRRFADENKGWLADYALFVALRQELKHRPWQDWPVPLRDRDSQALDAARERLAESVARVEFEQFAFFEQWRELREYANRRGVLLFGDMPIFIASDSADVWSQREYFDLREDGQARVVAGVPPDYFSATGQRWGNPHYNWARMEADGFRWWLDRIRGQLALYDWVRIDHFRGFEAYWEIPAESETAMHGHWVQAPGEALLEAVFATLKGACLPLVAENLGIITPEVESLRNRFDIPGMLILQFAFDGGPHNPYLPHNHTPNNVVYTGTHDNDTTLSWFEGLPESQRQRVYEYLGHPNSPMPWALSQSALASVAKLAILPMQDILEQGKGYRMNTPGTMDDGNWRWRFSWDELKEEQSSKLARLVRLYGRYPGD